MFKNLVQKRVSEAIALTSAVSIVRDPNNTKAVFDLSDALESLATTEDLNSFAEELCRDPKAIAAIEERYRLGPVDLTKLMELPKNTLGRTYVEHLMKNQVMPATLRIPEVSDDVSYIKAHITETHDIWHTLTGFANDVAGELGLAAFGAAQLPSQFQMLLLGGGLINTALYDFEDRHRRMDSIVHGWNMGKESEKLFGVRWNELWNEPIAKLRRELKIKVA
ncbi:MAG: Coq4 family protein [Bdellovibrionia bacterium]